MLELNSANEWLSVILPSQGIYYDDKCPGGEVEITPWTLAQEETMLKYQDRNPSQMIHALVKGNTKLPPGMSVEDLLLTDQYFLLINLRAVSMTQFLSFEFTCQCRKTSTVQMDLYNLDVKVPSPGDKEPISVYLPRCKKNVGLRFLRVADSIKAREYADKVSANDGGKPDMRFKLARQIVTINGEAVKFDEAMDFIRNLILTDVYCISDALDQSETGYVTSHDIQCPVCGITSKGVNIPLHENFFRPRRDDIGAAAKVAVGNKKNG